MQNTEENAINQKEWKDRLLRYIHLQHALLDRECTSTRVSTSEWHEFYEIYQILHANSSIKLERVVQFILRRLKSFDENRVEYSVHQEEYDLVELVILMLNCFTIRASKRLLEQILPCLLLYLSKNTQKYMNQWAAETLLELLAAETEEPETIMEEDNMMKELNNLVYKEQVLEKKHFHVPIYADDSIQKLCLKDLEDKVLDYLDEVAQSPEEGNSYESMLSLMIKVLREDDSNENGHQNSLIVLDKPDATEMNRYWIEGCPWMALDQQSTQLSEKALTILNRNYALWTESIEYWHDTISHWITYATTYPFHGFQGNSLVGPFALPADKSIEYMDRYCRSPWFHWSAREYLLESLYHNGDLFMVQIAKQFAFSFHTLFNKCVDAGVAMPPKSDMLGYPSSLLGLATFFDMKFPNRPRRDQFAQWLEYIHSYLSLSQGDQHEESLKSREEKDYWYLIVENAAWIDIAWTEYIYSDLKNDFLVQFLSWFYSFPQRRTLADVSNIRIWIDDIVRIIHTKNGVDAARPKLYGNPLLAVKLLICWMVGLSLEDDREEKLKLGIDCIEYILRRPELSRDKIVTSDDGPYIYQCSIVCHVLYTLDNLSTTPYRPVAVFERNVSDILDKIIRIATTLRKKNHEDPASPVRHSIKDLRQWINYIKTQSKVW